MGCCNGSVLVLVVCTIQLVTILERLVFDFMGFLYLSIIPGLVQIVIVIVAIFGLCLYKHRLIVVYLVWNVIYIAWNIFVICLYMGVGSLHKDSYKILGFGTGSSWWLKKFTDGPVEGDVVEVIHAGVQILLSVIGCVSSAFVIYLLREKDDTNPVFQVYKAPSSRRSSISLRLENRETSLTRPEEWQTPTNGRDSIRSNRSTRSTRSVARTDGGQNPNRQSKRSNRGSTRSRKSSHGKSGQNGSAKGNRPNALPWAPTIAPSSGLDSDVPQSPQTPPPQRQHRDRGHENESYGYGSSSEAPYTDHGRGQFISPGPPPGPAPAANRKYKPTNLAQSFNAAADLPPPLDEGPEAYSRDSVAFPAPPPPLSDGPEPYRSSHEPERPARSGRPAQLTIPPTPTKQALSSSPSSPGSSSLSTEKSLSDFNMSRTLENNLDRPAFSNKNYHKPPPVPVYKPDNAQPMDRPPVANSQAPGRDVNNPRQRYDSAEQVAKTPPRNEATSNPMYANHRGNTAGGLDMHRPPQHTHPPPSLIIPPKLPSKDVQPTDNLDGDLAAANLRQLSPNSDLRQIRSADSQPKDNTFKRLVSGNLSVRATGHDPPATRGAAHPTEAPSRDRYASQSQVRPEVVPPTSHQHSTSNPTPHQPQYNHINSRAPPASLHDRPRDQNFNNRSGLPHNLPRKDNSPIGDKYPSNNTPPWESRKPADMPSRNGPAVNSQQRAPTHAASSNVVPSNALTGTLKEVTSSYGGLYSSRQSPAPSRRRGQRPISGHNYPSNNYEPYQSTNITDDVKTTKGPFISSQPSVI